MSEEQDKKLIDDIFSRLISSPSSPNRDSKEESSNIDNMEEFAVGKALEELEAIKDLFIEFQERAGEYVVFSFLINQVQEFAQYAGDLQEAIEDNIDESKLSPESLRKYRSIKKLRAQVLSKIINKYRKQGG